MFDEKAYRRAYYKKNKKRLLARYRKNYLAKREYYLANSRKWYRKNRARRYAIARKWDLKQYGLTPEQYAALVAKQRGRCRICRDNPKTLCVDHDHVTNEVRGLLCGSCNRALGLFKDKTSLMRKAVAYLERRPRR